MALGREFHRAIDEHLAQRAAALALEVVSIWLEALPASHDCPQGPVVSGPLHE